MMYSTFNTTVQVMRRLSLAAASRDSLNNPVYGVPTQAPWYQVYAAMPARIALSAKPLEFAQTSERIIPNGVVYIPANYTVYHEDRLLTTNGIEYVVTSVVPGYVISTVIDHYELQIALP